MVRPVEVEAGHGYGRVDNGSHEFVPVVDDLIVLDEHLDGDLARRRRHVVLLVQLTSLRLVAPILEPNFHLQNKEMDQNF